MDRNREARRATIMGSNGFNRRRHRMSGLRDSPDEDEGLELQESVVRLRERVKKDNRETERDLRERSNRRKRRRAGDETSDESFSGDEDEEDEEHAAAVVTSGVRLVAPPVVSVLNHHHVGGALANHQHSSNFGQNTNPVSNNHQLQHRKTFPLDSSASKVFRSSPVWKAGDEMIGVSVPRKARSASTKRSNDWISSSSNNNSGGAPSGRDQTLRQDSSSPARHGPVPSAAAAAPVSPSSNAKKLKTNSNSTGGPKPKPPKASSKPSSSNPEELEREIAEVLYGMMTQSHGPSVKKEETGEANGSNVDAKSRNSSPISNSSNLSYPSLGTYSSPPSVVAPKRKRPRQVPDNPSADPQVKAEVSSPLEKATLENGNGMGAISVDSHAVLEKKTLESSKMDSDFKESSKEWRDFAGKVEVSSSLTERESLVTRDEKSGVKDSSVVAAIKSNLVSTEKENPRDVKFQIDLMAPPPHTRSSPETEAPDGSMSGAANPKLILSLDPTALKKVKECSVAEEDTAKERMKEGDSQKIADDNRRVIDLHLHLEKAEREANSGRNKPPQNSSKQTQQLKATRDEEESVLGPSTSAVPLPLPMASWPGGVPPVGYMNMTPLQGVVPIDGSSVAQPHLQPLMSQPRPKRCATHFHIAKNIQFLQNIMKMNPFWPGSPGAASLFGSKSCNVNALPTADLQGGNLTLRAAAAPAAYNNAPNNGKEKGGQAAPTKQQVLIQQALPPVAAGSLLGPAFIFPVNQQLPPPAAAAAAKPSAPGPLASVSSGSSPVPSSAAMSFSYPNMAPGNESQYLAILPNNGYPFPVPVVGAPPSYRGAPPQGMQLFNGPSFYSSQMILPSHLQQLQAQPNASASNTSSQKLMPSQSSATNQMEKKTHQVQLQSKGGAESLPGSFAMSFQSSTEAARQNIRMMVAQNNFRISEDAKSSAVDSSINGNDKKLAVGKASGVGHSIAFARSDVPESLVVAPVQASNVTESSGRSPVNRSSSTGNSMGSVTNSNANIQSQIQLLQQQQELQRLSSTPVDRSKVLTSTPAKFRSGISGCFPQTQVQSSPGSPNQQSNWKTSSRTIPTSQVPPSSLSSATMVALKNLPPQQNARASQPPVLTQISFGENQKALSTSHGQVAAPITSQPPSSTPVMVGSPATPISKGTKGSPRVATTPSAQPSKNPSASVLGNLQLTSTVNNGAKKYPQLFYNPYMPPQSGSMSAGVLSVNTPISGTIKNDPAKAIAGATSNTKGGGALSSQISQFPAQSAGTVLPAGFSYLHPVPAAVQVKPAEQKQYPA